MRIGLKWMTRAIVVLGLVSFASPSWAAEKQKAPAKSKAKASESSKGKAVKKAAPKKEAKKAPAKKDAKAAKKDAKAPAKAEKKAAKKSDDKKAGKKKVAKAAKKKKKKEPCPSNNKVFCEDWDNCHDKSKMTRCFQVGYYYQNGQHVSANPALAMIFYRKACTKKSGDGCVHAAMIMEEFRVEEKSNKKALALYVAGCENKAPQGCMKAGFMYRDGLGTEKNPKLAASYLAKACAKGYSNACAAHVILGLNKKSGKKEIAALKKQCEKQSSRIACIELASMSESGRIMKKDLAAALKYHKLACYVSSQPSCFTAGMMYLRGKGTAKNLKMAKKYLNIACITGMRKACELGKIKLKKPFSYTPKEKKSDKKTNKKTK